MPPQGGSRHRPRDGEGTKMWLPEQKPWPGATCPAEPLRLPLSCPGGNLPPTGILLGPWGALLLTASLPLAVWGLAMTPICCPAHLLGSVLQGSHPGQPRSSLSSVPVKTSVPARSGFSSQAHLTPGSPHRLPPGMHGLPLRARGQARRARAQQGRRSG